MLSKIKIKQDLLKKIDEEIYNNPNTIYFGLYKDYSKYNGTIYGQDNNIYLIVTSSITYVNFLQKNGFHLLVQINGRHRRRI